MTAYKFTLSDGGLARMMGVFCITGPGGSSLPSWRKEFAFKNWKFKCWRIRAQVQAKALSVWITRRSLGWYSRSLLGPDRFCPGGRTSRSPRRRLRLRPCPYIPGWLWPDSDMMLCTWLTDWLTADWCQHNASETQNSSRMRGNLKAEMLERFFFFKDTQDSRLIDGDWHK